MPIHRAGFVSLARSSAYRRQDSTSAPARRLSIGAEATIDVDRQKVGIGRVTVHYERSAPLVFSIEPLIFSIKNTMRASLRSVISTVSPVSRIRFGMSITDKGSVQCT